MAIAFDASSVSSSPAGSPESSRTFSHTCSGSNRLLVVGVQSAGFTTATSVLYNGVAADGSTNRFYTNTGVQFFWFINPTTGANNIVVGISPSAYVTCIGASFTGTDTTNPVLETQFSVFGVNGYSRNVAAGSPYSTPLISSYANSTIIALMGEQGGTTAPTAGAGYTLVAAGSNITQSCLGAMEYSLAGQRLNYPAWTPEITSTTAANQVIALHSPGEPLIPVSSTNAFKNSGLRPHPFQPGIAR